MIKVINFHDVKDINWFDTVIGILKSKYKIITTQDLIDYYAGNKKFKKSCLITIDDGDRTFYDIIFPILKKHNTPAVLFVSPDACQKQFNFWFQEARGLGLNSEAMKSLPNDEMWKMINNAKAEKGIADKPCFNMTVEQLKEVDRHGLVEIGAHTIYHPILANETDERSRKEIIDSINGLEKMLGHEIKSFAYPNGQPKQDFGQREIDTLRGTTCKIAFSTESQNVNKKDEIYAVPRFGLSYGSVLFVKIKLFTGKYWKYIKKLMGK